MDLTIEQNNRFRSKDIIKANPCVQKRSDYSSEVSCRHASISSLSILMTSL